MEERGVERVEEVRYKYKKNSLVTLLYQLRHSLRLNGKDDQKIDRQIVTGGSAYRIRLSNYGEVEKNVAIKIFMYKTKTKM